jgi:outer membrane protein assembly factor BamB
VKGTEKLIVASATGEISAYGSGFGFDVEGVMDLPPGERLFAVGRYLVVSRPGASVISEGENVTDVPGFVSDDLTVLFTQVGEVYVQVASNGLVAFDVAGLSVRLEAKVHHAAALNNLIAVSSTGSQNLRILEFVDQQFTEKRQLDVADDVSGLHFAANGSLICSTWSKMKVLVFNVETGAAVEFASSFVVRSFAEIGGVVYMGTSRGEIYAARFNSDGVLEHVAKQALSGTGTLSKATHEQQELIFAAGDQSQLVSLDGDHLIVTPVVLDDVCLTQAQLSDGSVALLTREKVIKGHFQSAQLTKLSSKTLGASVALMTRIDDETIAVVTSDGQLRALSATLFEALTTFDLPDDLAYNYVSSFTLEGRTFVQLCASEKVVADPNFFSENGAVLTLQFTRSDFSISEARIVAKSCPTAIKFSDGVLFLTVGSLIQKYEVSLTESGDLALTEAGSADAIMLASDLAVGYSKVAIFDIFGSAAVFNPDLELIAVDRLAKGLVTGLFVDDTTLLTSDVRGNVYLLKEEEDRLITVGRLAIGEKVTSLQRWSPLENARFVTFAGVTAAGSILVFGVLNPALEEPFTLLEKSFAVFQEENGELNHTHFRAITSPSYREASFGIIDGDLVKAVGDLEGDDKQRFTALAPDGEVQAVIDAIAAFEIA